MDERLLPLIAELCDAGVELPRLMPALAVIEAGGSAREAFATFSGAALHARAAALYEDLIVQTHPERIVHGN